ncbi:MAG: hypothetical protein HeimC3_32700 [Candidatus Heimdallarchaeota archaeon LC_3]|nr:MAG: hypothetical protein HeimC3_32700 [Candidatus Heimdallarchaeota archaeon LC_3]
MFKLLFDDIVPGTDPLDKNSPIRVTTTTSTTPTSSTSNNSTPSDPLVDLLTIFVLLIPIQGAMTAVIFRENIGKYFQDSSKI